MKKLLLLLSLLISCDLFAVEKEVSLSYESAWNNVLQVLMAEGAMIKLSDKTSGVIQASKVHERNKSEQRSYYGDSCNPGGKIISITTNITVVVKEVNNDRSKIIIKGKGVIQSYGNSYFLFLKTGTYDIYTNCDSNGRLEDEFLTSFSKS